MSNIVFGNPQNIKEGTWYDSRAALTAAGLHRLSMHGIDGNGREGVAAIVLSGGYEDDIDLGDEIIYTGHGGNDTSSKKQMDHQSWDSPGNKGLRVSEHRKLPVRVIRGYKHKSPFSPPEGYRYCGLFKVVDSWEEIGKKGFKICRFKLKKINTESSSINLVRQGAMVLLEIGGKEKWVSIGVDAPNSQRISSDSKMAQLLLEKGEGDLIDFGAGFKIIEIRRYLS